MNDVDWGPRRPAAVTWAGILMLSLGAFQLIVMVAALVVDARSLLLGPAFTVSVAFIVVFAVLQLVAAVGVLRLSRAWRMFAMALAGVGALIHALKLFGDGDALLIAVKIGFALAYVLTFEFLRRSGPAFD